MACDRVVSDLMLSLWEEIWWPFLDAWDNVRPRATLRNGMSQGDMGRVVNSFFPLGKGANGPQGAESAGPSNGPQGELLLLLMQKKPTFVPDSEAFNSYIGDGFLAPELKDKSEASKDEQADGSSETTWVMACCLSSGYIDLAAQLPSSSRLGGGKGSLELPKSPGHVAPGIA